MRVHVHVYLKRAVLDPQGKAIAEALKNLGFDAVEGARQGKLIELEVSDDLDRTEVEAQVRTMCEKLLANPVMEDFDIEIVSDPAEMAKAVSL